MLFGFCQSILRAHNNLKPATLHINSGDLLGASENRSPYSYFQNPAEELSRQSLSVLYLHVFGCELFLFRADWSAAINKTRVRRSSDKNVQ